LKIKLKEQQKATVVLIATLKIRFSPCF